MWSQRLKNPNQDLLKVSIFNLIKEQRSGEHVKQDSPDVSGFVDVSVAVAFEESVVKASVGGDWKHGCCTCDIANFLLLAIYKVPFRLSRQMLKKPHHYRVIKEGQCC